MRTKLERAKQGLKIAALIGAGAAAILTVIGVGFAIGMLVAGWMFLPMNHPIVACIGLLVIAMECGFIIGWMES